MEDLGDSWMKDEEGFLKKVTPGVRQSTKWCQLGALGFDGANNRGDGLAPKMSKRMGDLGFGGVKVDLWNWMGYVERGQTEWQV